MSVSLDACGVITYTSACRLLYIGTELLQIGHSASWPGSAMLLERIVPLILDFSLYNQEKERLHLRAQLQF